MQAALEEVRESLGGGPISPVAVDERGAVLGWIGGIRSYGGNVWEHYPLVVRPDLQRRGIGRALVADLESRVRERGALTLWLGTDDEDGMTTLSGVDLYPNVAVHLQNIKTLRGHPYEFHQKLGFLHNRGDARRERARQAGHLHGQEVPLRPGKESPEKNPGSRQRLLYASSR
jgi:aminoglycoside 6'-N-acetyltransferase I